MPDRSARYDFDVNLSAVFGELPLLEQPGAAASAGFRAVELWWPFVSPVPAEAELGRLTAALGEAATLLVACNLYEGDRAGGDRGILSVVGINGLFADNVASAIQLGRATGCRIFNALYGNHEVALTPSAQQEVAVERLLIAGRAVAAIGGTIVLEVLNPIDNPRYALDSYRAAIDLIGSVAAEGTDNIRLLVDLYHAAKMGDDLDETLAAAAGRIGHVQIADVPGRHQPGTGRLGARGLLAPLERAGYAGWIGLEYSPLGPAATSFGWLAEERARCR